MELFRQKD